MSNVLAELNDAQRAAVTAGDGPLCIVAGPGTGKTKTLTARIAYLISHHKVAPSDILALTFTNKAAREMQSRVGNLLVGQATAPQITTFHGLCYQLLSRDAEELRLITEADRLELLRTLRSGEAKDMTTRELSARISRAKSVAPDSDIGDPPLAVALQKYNAALRGQDLYDFDDLLQQTFAKLDNDTSFRQTVQQRWQYILVDEFQDTNELQYRLLRLLTVHDSFFVIGDPSQSIYGFRGATGDIFERFAADFPHGQRITLTANYRSAPEIVQVANTIFPKAPKLEAQQKVHGSAQTRLVLNEYREAGWVVQAIEQAFGGTDFQRSHQLVGQAAEQSRSFGDYAVLYRTHHVARAIKRAFAESGIPHQCVGDDSPYLQKPLRTAVAVLRRIAQPETDLAASDMRLLQAIPRKLLDDLGEKQSLPPTRLLAEIIETCRLTRDNPAATRDVHQTLGTLVRFDNLPHVAFLEQFDELAGQDFYDPSTDAVTLLTIHAAKGLEFGYVFLIAAEEGILPHPPKDADQSEGDETQQSQHLEEEKRLFYVAVTRAREQLTILHAKTRAGQSAALSPFVGDIPDSILPRLTDPDLAKQQHAQTKRALKNAQMGLF